MASSPATLDHFSLLLITLKNFHFNESGITLLVSLFLLQWIYACKLPEIADFFTLKLFSELITR